MNAKVSPRPHNGHKRVRAKPKVVPQRRYDADVQIAFERGKAEGIRLANERVDAAIVKALHAPVVTSALTPERLREAADCLRPVHTERNFASPESYGGDFHRDEHRSREPVTIGVRIARLVMYGTSAAVSVGALWWIFS